MLNESEFKNILTGGSPNVDQAAIDQKIDENIQRRELSKLREQFYQHLKSYYSNRKYREVINLNCSDRCLKTYREDDITRSETNCLINCYNKCYRYLGFSSTLYTYLLGGEDVENHVKDNYDFSEEGKDKLA